MILAKLFLVICFVPWNLGHIHEPTNLNVAALGSLGIEAPGQGQGQSQRQTQGSQNQGFQNQGSQNQGFQNQGFQNQGFQNQGFQNQGFQNQGFQNQGFQNQGFQNQGFQNQGFQNQGFQNHAFQNQPSQNQGFQNQGFQNQGFQSSHQPQQFNSFQSNFHFSDNWDSQKKGTPQQSTEAPKAIPKGGERNCRKFEPNQVTSNRNSFYFMSWFDPKSQGKIQLQWNEAREFCIRHCMDLVAIETPQENDFIISNIRKGDIYGAFTGGKFCNSKNCSYNSYNLLENWNWISTGQNVGPYWSQTGGMNLPQPDNLRGRFKGKNEECLAFLNNWYNDGVSWHDFVCSDPLPFICEATKEEEELNNQLSGGQKRPQPQQNRPQSAPKRANLPQNQRPPLPHQRQYRHRYPSQRRRNMRPNYRP